MVRADARVEPHERPLVVVGEQELHVRSTHVVSGGRDLALQIVGMEAVGGEQQLLQGPRQHGELLGLVHLGSLVRAAPEPGMITQRSRVR